MLGDIFQSAHLKQAEIVLNDINEAAALRTLDMAQDYIAAQGLGQSVTVERDLARALTGADFVVISIEVGDRFALWDLDWRVPQQFGIPQVYGENGGPGGLFHALRIIPPILEICGKVMEHAPNATVFNYSNPMSRITTTVHRKYPGIKFIGMCHEIASLERHLPPMLGVDRDRIHYRAGGLNHFSVMTECTYVDSGKDAHDEVIAKAQDYFAREPGYSEILAQVRKTGTSVETEGWMEIDLSGITEIRDWSDRWLFKVVLDRFGVLPITGDSHFGEYIQWAHDCADHRGILDFYTFYRHELGTMKPRIAEHLHERVVPMIDAMVGGERYEEAAVNMPNAGFIADLPDWIAVEVPAHVGPDGVQGIAVDIPAGFRGLLCNQIGIHNMTAEAVLQGKRELAVQALLVDPIVTTYARVGELVDYMIDEQAPWLDYLK